MYVCLYSFGRELHLVTSHTGFVRMAIKHGVSLVPVLSFGENQVCMRRNVYYCADVLRR